MECYHLQRQKSSIQLRGVRPFFSDKYDITRHKRYRQLPLEKVIMNIIRTKYMRPGTRKFEMTNLYEKPPANPKTNKKGDKNVRKKKKR